ncbi:hypothetical protein CCY99_06190 [Helicobacter sp. 16-1353]|uniref:cell division protein FtsX n=1 Tax=Helicobacter sp. 16-1353 TaxID=2004996 RepID=UPI000DCEF9A0|nr:cell division protein FtsX [Helicobacter sp. 16-1353]RAX53180.1 hypothetical protein CCY99_06190 [Helicobacter sp. 16-1353]
MRWFRQYISLLVPLIALLVGIESILLVNRAVLSHEELIGKNYAIVVVSKTELNESDIKQKVSEIHSLNKLDTSGILSEINAEFQSSNIDDLKDSLPFFYTLTLNSFPNQHRIKQIENDLLSLGDITRIESFSKSHNQTYRLLVLLKGCVLVLSSLIFILSFLLMIKQIEVWRFEHSERMEIMTYLGAHSKFKNAPLYRLALIDSIISSLFVIILVLILSNNNKINSIISMLGINIFSLKTFVLDYFILLFSAYVISMFSVFMVILFQKEP